MSNNLRRLYIVNKEVPQGTTLGPFLLMIQKFFLKIQNHMLADDTATLVDESDWNGASNNLNKWSKELRCVTNYLSLNTYKTIFIFYYQIYKTTY